MIKNLINYVSFYYSKMEADLTKYNYNFEGESCSSVNFEINKILGTYEEIAKNSSNKKYYHNFYLVDNILRHDIFDNNSIDKGYCIQVNISRIQFARFNYNYSAKHFVIYSVYDHLGNISNDYKDCNYIIICFPNKEFILLRKNKDKINIKFEDKLIKFYNKKNYNLFDLRNSKLPLYKGENNYSITDDETSIYDDSEYNDETQSINLDIDDENYSDQEKSYCSTDDVFDLSSNCSMESNKKTIILPCRKKLNFTS